MLEVGSHLYAQELSMLHGAPFGGGMRDDVQNTRMSPRLGLLTAHSCDSPPALLLCPLCFQNPLHSIPPLTGALTTVLLC